MNFLLRIILCEDFLSLLNLSFSEHEQIQFKPTTKELSHCEMHSVAWAGGLISTGLSRQNKRGEAAMTQNLYS